MTHIQSTLQKIDSVDLESEDAIDKIYKIVSTELRKLPAFLTDLGIGEPLVRCRYLNETEEFHKTIQDFSYNPFVKYIKVGRANYEGQQVFYGSRFRITSLAEVRFVYANREKDEAIYSMGRWEARDKLGLAAIVTPESIRRHNATELFGLAEYIEKAEYECRNDPELSGFIDIYRYMASKFAETVQEGEEYKYKITAVFSNFIFSRFNLADGILYQSVQYPENFNVALKKEVVDAGKIKLAYASRQRYIRTGMMNYKEDGSAMARNIDYNTGEVVW